MWQYILYAHRRRCKSKNSQAKGLDSDEALESSYLDCRLAAPTKQLSSIDTKRNLSGKVTEA